MAIVYKFRSSCPGVLIKIITALKILVSLVWWGPVLVKLQNDGL